MKAVRIILSAFAMLVALGGTIAGTIAEKSNLTLSAVNTFTGALNNICSTSTDCGTDGQTSCATQAYQYGACTTQVSGKRP